MAWRCLDRWLLTNFDLDPCSGLRKIRRTYGRTGRTDTRAATVALLTQSNGATKEERNSIERMG